MRYEKLPKATPRWLVISIFLLGGCLGLSISVYALIALHGLYGFLGDFFFPDSLNMQLSEAVYFGITGLTAAITTVLLSFLAYDMYILSRKAASLSQIAWLPCVLTTALVWWGGGQQQFTHHFSANWVIAAGICIILGGILPALLFTNKAAQKLHKR